jgi:hypothetical protein
MKALGNGSALAVSQAGEAVRPQPQSVPR